MKLYRSHAEGRITPAIVGMAPWRMQCDETSESFAIAHKRTMVASRTAGPALLFSRYR